MFLMMSENDHFYTHVLESDAQHKAGLKFEIGKVTVKIITLLWATKCFYFRIALTFLL